MRGFCATLAIVSMMAALFCAGPAAACDGFARVSVCNSSCSAQVVVQRQILVPRVQTVVAKTVAVPVQVQAVEAVAPEPEQQAVQQPQAIKTQQVQVLRVLQPVCNNVCQVQKVQKVRTRRGLFGRRITKIVER